MNRRQIDHFGEQVQKALLEIQNADSGRVQLPCIQNKIKFIEDKVKAIQKADWNLGDELQEALTHVCLENRSL